MTTITESSGLRSRVFNQLRSSRDFGNPSWGTQYENHLDGSRAVWLGGTIGSYTDLRGLSTPITPANFSDQLINKHNLNRRSKASVYAFAFLIMNNSRRILTCFSEDLTPEDLNKAIEGICAAVEATQEGKEVYIMAGSDKLIALVENCNRSKELKELMTQRNVDLVFLHSMKSVNEANTDVIDIINRAVKAPEFLKHQDVPNMYVQANMIEGVEEERIYPFIPVNELVILPWNGVEPGFASKYDPHYTKLLDKTDEKVKRLATVFNEEIGPPADISAVEVLDATDIVLNYDDFLRSLLDRNAKILVIKTCHSGSVCGIGDASIPNLIGKARAKGIDCYGATINGQPATNRYPSGNAAIAAGLKMIDTFPDILIGKLLSYIPLNLSSGELESKIRTPIADEISVYNK